jgi:hypothetical protein
MMSDEREVVEIEHTFACDAGWDDMEGSDKERHCYTCSKQVHNLSAMTEHEAALFVDRHRGAQACIRAQVDEDGYVKFAAPSGPRRLALPPRLTLASAALTLPMLLAGCEAEPGCDSSNTTARSPQLPAGLSFSDPYHPREGIRSITEVPAARRSLLLKIVGFRKGAKSRFEGRNAEIEGGASFK